MEIKTIKTMCVELSDSDKENLNNAHELLDNLIEEIQAFYDVKGKDFRDQNFDFVLDGDGYLCYTLSELDDMADQLRRLQDLVAIE